MGQMAACCQSLTLGALSSHSALSVLVGVLFKTFSLFLNTLHITKIQETYLQLLLKNLDNSSVLIKRTREQN